MIADNCSDNTAGIALSAGATVLERVEPGKRGKGHALTWGIQRLPLEECDAVAILDADSLMDECFLVAASDRLRRGDRIIQGYDGIANPDDSALTQLISITNVLKNLLYNNGKSVLGFSPHLMGIGMVIHRDVLLEKGWTACSIVESIEQSISYISSGEKVAFAPEARVFAQEARSLRQAMPQRQRWASGQLGLLSRAIAILHRGIVRRDVILIDSAMDLLLPVRYSMTTTWRSPLPGSRLPR